MGKEFEYTTDFLFPEGSFIMGAGSVLDMNGSYFSYNFSPDGQEADRLAIKSDWGVIGQDIKKAMSLWDKSNDSKPR